MADVLHRLKTALSDRYAIEREIGAGGMATVYLAEDLKHHRKVAVKVLSPEIAFALGSERFLREIEIAAGLQHPHVVPLHDSGDADGLLYYVMPYVEGEPLRAKLTREGALPVNEIVRILRDVVDALAHAHERGVVHRDVKPDNVMLSGHHAVVMDFGVAKAVSEAADSTTLTSTGLALGTPAYMAPEQASANPTVDHRADIYAVGVLAYQMVAGRPPFDGATPQAVLAAHVVDTPEPIENFRASVPPALASLINRCLEKLPADRVQETSDLLHEIEAMATPSGTAPYAAPAHVALRTFRSAHLIALYGVAAATVAGVSYALMIALGLPDFVVAATLALLVVGLPILLFTLRQERRRLSASQSKIAEAVESAAGRWLTWRRAIAGGMVAFAGLALFVAGYMLMRTLGIGPAGTLVSTGVLEERGRIILADFVDRSGDTSRANAVTEAFRIDLGQSPAVTLVQGSDLTEAFARMQREPPRNITVDLAREVATREGIRAVVSGEINSVGGSYVLSAQLLDATTGNVLVPLRETARDSTELVEALDRLSKGLRERVGESLKSIRGGPALERVATASLPALRKFSQASRASDAGEAGRAVTLFQEAIALDSAFAGAYRSLSLLLGNYAIERALAMTSIHKAYEYRDRLTERERLWTEGAYHLQRDETQEALNVYLTLLDMAPDDAALLNNIGVVYSESRQHERALEYFTRSRDIDPSSQTAAFNIVGMNIELGRLAEARAANESFATTFPGHPMYHVNRFFIAIAEYDYPADEEAIDTWAEYGDMAGAVLATRGKMALAGIRGQLSNAERAFEASRTRAASGQQVREFLVDAISVGRFEIGALGSVDQALARVEAALESFPLIQLEPFDRPYAELAEFYARAGRVDAAREMLAQFEREVPEEFRKSTETDYQRALGFLALAEGRTDEARDSFLRSDRGVCMVCVFPPLAHLYDQVGNSDSLFAVLDRYVNTPDDDRIYVDPFELPGAYVRLGELYEQRGDRDDAIRYYSEFVALWKDADPELQPQVEDVRRRIARLVGEP